MSDQKTLPTKQSVSDFLNQIDDEQKRRECFQIVKMMKNITKKEPVMWGSSIIGFDTYHYIYASGREGDWPVTGFSPRKQTITIYIMNGFDEYKDLLKKLGKVKHSKSCLYIKKLEEIDKDVLQQIIEKSVKKMKKNYPN